MRFRLILDFLECVSSGTIRRFEWIFRQFKEETRRLSSAKSRINDTEMSERRPKLRIKEFLRHTLGCRQKHMAFCFAEQFISDSKAGEYARLNAHIARQNV